MCYELTETRSAHLGTSLRGAIPATVTILNPADFLGLLVRVIMSVKFPTPYRPHKHSIFSAPPLPRAVDWYRHRDPNPTDLV